MNFPATIKAEVKLTTSTSVQISARELEALRVTEHTSVGLLAVLFWSGDRNVDGQWIIVDASRIRHREAESVSVTKTAMLSTSRARDPLNAVRQHAAKYWPAFLYAFRDEALQGHAALVEVLERCHRNQLVAERLPEHAILAVEHSATVQEIIRFHGESDAGRLMQDLLAYMLAFIGYRAVTNNAVGVPDFVLADLGGVVGREPNVLVELTFDEARRIIELCQSAGHDDLAHAVDQSMRFERADRER